MKERIFYDFATRNKYFLDLHQYLKSKRIKNNKFMLKIYDTELISIDPFDLNLSESDKQKVLDEIEKNFFYYVREIVRIYQQGGGICRPKFNIANLAQLYLYDNNISSWTSCYRQSFKTITVCIIESYNRLFDKKDNNYCSHGYDKFVESKVDSIYELLPDYIKNHKFNSDSKRNISYFDDAEFIEQLESKISNDDLNIFTSIINKNADELGILKIYDKYAIDWDELFFDKLPEIKDNKQFVHIKYTYKELGISEEDLKIMKSILNHDEDLIKREIILVRD